MLRNIHVPTRPQRATGSWSVGLVCIPAATNRRTSSAPEQESSPGRKRGKPIDLYTQLVLHLHTNPTRLLLNALLLAYLEPVDCGTEAATNGTFPSSSDITYPLSNCREALSEVCDVHRRLPALTRFPVLPKVNWHPSLLRGWQMIQQRIHGMSAVAIHLIAVVSRWLRGDAQATFELRLQAWRRDVSMTYFTCREPDVHPLVAPLMR